MKGGVRAAGKVCCLPPARLPGKDGLVQEGHESLNRDLRRNELPRLFSKMYFRSWIHLLMDAGAVLHVQNDWMLYRVPQASFVSWWTQLQLLLPLPLGPVFVFTPPFCTAWTTTSSPSCRRARGSCVAEELPWLLAICFAPDLEEHWVQGPNALFLFYFSPKHTIISKTACLVCCWGCPSVMWSWWYDQVQLILQATVR